MRFENRGLAATLAHVAGLLGMAHMQGRAMVLADAGAWGYARGEPCAGFECYFEAWGGCNASRAGAQGAFQVGRAAHANVFAMVPPRFAHKGVFWWRAVLAAWLFRVRPALLAPGAPLDVAAQQAAQGWARPVVGVHVRVGDSCNKWALHFNASCLPAAAHARAALALVRRYGARTVFVATDDAGVRAALAASLAAEAPGVRVVGAAGALGDRAGTSSAFAAHGVPSARWIEHRLQAGEIPARPVAHQALLDLLLLARCDALVLQLASNLSRLALALAAAHSARLVPFLSLDGPPCYHWQLCCEGQPDGSSVMC